MRRVVICVLIMNKCSGYLVKYIVVLGNVYQKYFYYFYVVFVIIGVDYFIFGQQLLRLKII